MSLIGMWRDNASGGSGSGNSGSIIKAWRNTKTFTLPLKQATSQALAISAKQGITPPSALPVAKAPVVSAAPAVPINTALLQKAITSKLLPLPSNKVGGITPAVSPIAEQAMQIRPKLQAQENLKNYLNQLGGGSNDGNSIVSHGVIGAIKSAEASPVGQQIYKKARAAGYEFGNVNGAGAVNRLVTSYLGIPQDKRTEDQQFTDYVRPSGASLENFKPAKSDYVAKGIGGAAGLAIQAAMMQPAAAGIVGATALSRAAPFVQRLATSGLLGAAQSGITSYGNNETAGQTALHALENAGLYAGGDAAIEGIGRGAKKILSPILAERAARSAEGKAVANANRLIPASPLERAAESNPARRVTLPSVASEAAASNVIRPAGAPISGSVRGGEAIPAASNHVVLSTPKEPLTFKGALDNAKQAGSKLYTSIVDKNNPISRADKDAYTRALNSANAGGVVDFNLEKGLADKQGNVIGKSLKAVVSDIPKGKEQKFWDYMAELHNIDRAREGKNVIANHTSEMSQTEVSRMLKENPEFKKTGEGITNWIDSFMKTWGVDTGIVDKDVYASLRGKYKNYFPTQREFSELEKSVPESISKKFVDQRTPIKTATGSARDISNPVGNIMNLVNRTVRTAKYNEVGRSLLSAIKKSPDEMARFAEIIPAKDGMLRNTDNIVTVLEKGKPVYLKINDKALLDSLNGIPKATKGLPVLPQVTNLYKSLITQKNPIFALRNIARDIPTAYTYATKNGEKQLYNPFVFARDLGGAAKDIVANNDRLKRYQAVGGGGANFFNSGDVMKSVERLTGKENVLKKIISAPVRGIEKFNNLTEAAPRLAEFNRVFAATGSTDKALAAANDVTVNFSRGGNLTKTLDKNGVAYLNAGVQGIDKFFRAFKSPKAAVATLSKIGLGIATPDVALYLINRNNPNYQALDNRTKDNYLLIPNAADGGKTFIKIPKAREVGTVATLLERVARLASGEKNAFQGFGTDALTNFAPTNPIENNLLSPATWNIATNKDFANRTIVPAALQNLSPKYQYDEKTSELAKVVGKQLNLSPKQIDYLITSYTGVIGQLGLPLSVKANYKDGNVLNGLTKSVTNQFASNPLYSNQSLQDFYNNLQKAKTASADKKFIGQNNYAEKDVYSYMSQAQSKMSDIQKQINALNPTKDAAQITALRQQMLSTAKDANNYTSGIRTGAQTLQSQINQFNYAKSDANTAAKNDVISALGSGNLVSISTLINKYGLTAQQAKALITNAKNGIKTDQYSDVVQNYLGMSKLNRQKFYNALPASQKKVLEDELSKYNLNP